MSKRNGGVNELLLQFRSFSGTVCRRFLRSNAKPCFPIPSRLLSHLRRGLCQAQQVGATWVEIFFCRSRGYGPPPNIRHAAHHLTVRAESTVNPTPLSFSGCFGRGLPQSQIGQPMRTTTSRQVPSGFLSSSHCSLQFVIHQSFRIWQPQSCNSEQTSQSGIFQLVTIGEASPIRHRQFGVAN